MIPLRPLYGHSEAHLRELLTRFDFRPWPIGYGRTLCVPVTEWDGSSHRGADSRWWIQPMMQRLLRSFWTGNDVTIYIECRDCGDGLATADTHCPTCGSEEIATYELSLGH